MKMGGVGSYMLPLHSGEKNDGVTKVSAQSFCYFQAVHPASAFDIGKDQIGGIGKGMDNGFGAFGKSDNFPKTTLLQDTFGGSCDDGIIFYEENFFCHVYLVTIKQ